MNLRLVGRPHGTLRGRLALVATIATAAWVALLTVGFNLVLAAQLHAQAGTVLRERAASAAATVVVTGDGHVLGREPRPDAALDEDTWIFAGPVALERPRVSTALQAQADRMVGHGEVFAQVEDPVATRFFALPIYSGTRQVGTVVAAVALEPYRTIQQAALLGSVGLVVLLLLGVYGASRVVVGRALAPVGAMSRQAAQWSAEDPTQRFGGQPRPGELASLAANLDGVLDRLAAVLRHEQRLTEELSHELRTPLTRIAAETELLRGRRRPVAEREAAYGRIADSAQQMLAILETLLSAARSRSLPHAARSPLLPTAQRAAQRAQADAAAPRVSAGGDGEVLAGVDEALVERILAPLLDNALRYAGQEVRVEVSQRGEWALLRVVDDGPGVPAELREAVFEPGRRGPQDGHPGAGLGLPLARRLARSAGGDLGIDEQGAFVVRLPKG